MKACKISKTLQKQENRKIKNKKITGKMLAIVLFMTFSVTLSAAENLDLSPEFPKEDIISIACHKIEENGINPFDFILDSQGLLYETNAIRYGGGTVEEGATLLFHNQKGEYDFSKNSDFLTVTNYSTVPVIVTVSAQIHGLGKAEIVESDDFSDEGTRSIYLAVVDTEGNVCPLTAEGEVSVAFELQPAPDSAYLWKLDEESQTYRYELSQDVQEICFDTYSFGLTGACNPNAAWGSISFEPVVTINWSIEPILTEMTANEEDDSSEMQDAEEEEGSSTSEEIQGDDSGGKDDDLAEGENSLEGEMQNSEEEDSSMAEEIEDDGLAERENPLEGGMQSTEEEDSFMTDEVEYDGSVETENPLEGEMQSTEEEDTSMSEEIQGDDEKNKEDILASFVQKLVFRAVRIKTPLQFPVISDIVNIHFEPYFLIRFCLTGKCR